MRYSVLVLLLGVALTGCPEEEPPEKPPCDPEAQTHCDAGTVCEYVADGTTACFAPIEIRGMVFDSADGVGIEGATIVAIDANGAARSTVARSAADGSYSLNIPAERNTDGTLTGDTDVTLRADAAGYQPFPKAPRTALPVDVAVSTPDGEPPVQVVQTAVTDIALVALSDASGTGTISGTIAATDPGGVLVVALQGGSAVSSAVSDSLGAFILFDVPAGSTDVTGYRAGLALDVATADVAAGAESSVSLTGTTDGLATVTGNIQIVNAPGGATTSVILAPKSTFDATSNRGEAPAGLRVAGIAGDFEIPGVAPGDYVALAAFENDDLVRDPDTTIGGTAIVEVSVDGASATVALPESFKVTEALATLSPGADTLEVVNAVPTLEWADDSSEDGYEVRIYDAFGQLVYEVLDVPGVSGAETVAHTPAGLTLDAGMVYQFRAWSYRDKQGGKTYISATEDLRGVFLFE